MKRSHVSVLLLSSLALLLSASCSSKSALGDAAKSAVTFSTAKVWLEKVSFKVASDMNNNAPVAVHVLVVYNPDILEKLSKLPADKYFEQQVQLRKDFAENVDFFTWELVPNQNLSDQEITPTRVSGLAAIVFARYSSPGDHRATLGEERHILIDLQKKDFSVTPIHQ